MYSAEKIIQNHDLQLAKKNISILKITALWAFSESAFGGILHAISVPFRGVFISSFAVLFITLIALFAKSNKEILKSTLIVLLVKALVSPHTPLTAYFAVSIQGIIGYLVFSSHRFFNFSVFVLGVLTLLFSGIQKIVVLTIVFGNTLWKSINVFIKQISKEFFSLNVDGNINYGYLLISIYILIHIFAGIFIGLYASKLPSKLDKYKNELPSNLILKNIDGLPHKEKSKKKNWFSRPTGIAIIIISIAVLIFSYISPSTLEIGSSDIILMLIRSMIITIAWLLIIAPIIKSFLNKFLDSKKHQYALEINEIINLFPQFRSMVAFCWKNSSDKKSIKRIHKFLSTTFYFLLLK